MKGEEGVLRQGVAEEEQRGRRWETPETIEKWLRECLVELSAREVGAIRLLVQLDD